MRKKTLFLVLLLSVAIALPVGAKTLKFAFQGDVQSMDPYNLNETFHLGFWGNIYEGLIRRGPNLEIEPALAERWEVMEPTAGVFICAKASNSMTAPRLPPMTWYFPPPACDIRIRI